MLSFKGDKKLKSMLLKEISWHEKHDKLIQGSYGEGAGKDWKGCAVGCSIHSLNKKLGKDFKTSDHSVYESELGIPRQLAHLEDRIFENLPKKEAMKWPRLFWSAIPENKDLSLVVPKFMVWLMEDVKQYAKNFPDVLKSIEAVQALYKRMIEGGVVTDKEWLDAAKYTAFAAEYAAYAAEYAAYAAYAAEYAAYAAKYTAFAAEYTAFAAEYAAYAAKYTAFAAEYAAEYAAKFKEMAKKIIQLLKEVK